MDSNIKVGILIICIGKYITFLEDLYNSCEEFLLTGCEKTYYVFTDREIIQRNNIKRIDQSSLGWPYNTMNRFHMFNGIYDQLIKEDFLFFLNANMKCVNTIGEEIVPTEEHNHLMAVQHPGYIGYPSNNFPYERRGLSNFYIPYGDGEYYYQGCFNGGRSKEFLEMSLQLLKYINQDVSNGIIPIWHDESALNWYLLNRHPLMTSIQYAAPEGWYISDVKIMSRDKNKWGGHNYLRI